MWVCTDLSVLYADPYWECGSGSGSKSIEIDQIKKGFCTFVNMFGLSLTFQVYFHVKIQLFVTLKSDLHGTAWVGSLDPDTDLDPH
jgi:hypothetical protein